MGQRFENRFLVLQKRTALLQTSPTPPGRTNAIPYVHLRAKNIKVGLPLDESNCPRLLSATNNIFFFDVDLSMNNKLEKERLLF